MPNDWTITLCSLTSTWAVFYKQKQNASSFPFTRLAVLQHFNLSFKPSWLLCLFPDFNFTWMRKHYSKRTFHLKGLKIFQLLDCWRQQRSWRNVLLTRREGFLWFSRSANACTDPNWWCRELILTLKKKFSCFPIGQSALCKYGRYIFTDQLYLAVCTMIVATVWTVYSGFCILDLPKHHLLYVSDSFSLFFFFFDLGTDEQSASSALPLQREVNSRSAFYQGTVTLICKIRPFAGCRWSLTGLQTESSQQNGRPEWPNCTLNITSSSPPISFVFFITPLFAFF